MNAAGGMLPPAAFQSTTEAWRYLWLLAGIAGTAVTLAAAWLLGFFLPALLGLAAALAVGLCLRNYRTGIWLLLALSPTFVIHRENFGTYKLIFAALVTSAWLARRLLPAVAKSPPLLRHPMALPILTLALSASVSTLLSVDPGWSTKPLIKLIGNVIFIFIFADSLRSLDSVLVYFRTLLLAAGAEAVFGIFEFIHYFQPVALQPLYRSQATFGNPNIYGRYLGSILIFLCALIFYDHRNRAGRLVLAGLLAAGLITSFSRSSITGIALAVAVLAMVSLRPRWARPVFLGLVLVLTAGFILFTGRLAWVTCHTPDPSVMEGLEEGLEASSGASGNLVHQIFFRRVLRENIWRTGMKMAFDKPWLGHGLGMISYVSPLYISQTVDDIRMELLEWEETGELLPPSIANAHNAVLDIVVQIGLVGLAAICALYVVLFRQLEIFWRQSMDPLSRGMVMGGLAFLIFDLWVGFFEPACVFGPGSLGFIFVFFVAVILRIGTVRHESLA